MTHEEMLEEAERREEENKEETPETIEDVKQLHETIRELEKEAPDYGVGK